MLQSLTHPFAQLVDPEALASAVAHSERLARLRSRVFRPLDKPLIPRRDAAALEDAAVDALSEDELQDELAGAEAH